MQWGAPAVPCAFDAERHAYHAWSEHQGVWVPLRSVSQVMTESGLKAFDTSFWRRSLIRDGMEPAQADTYMREHTARRAAIGTAVHTAIQEHLLGAPLSPPAADGVEVLEIFTAVRDQCLSAVEAVHLIETPMVHRGLAYAGTPDLVATINGELTLVDWKTKASADKARVSDEWRFQLAAYRELVLHNYGVKVNRAINLMAWPGGTKAVRWNRADLHDAMATFLADGLLPFHQQQDNAVGVAAINNIRRRLGV